MQLNVKRTLRKLVWMSVFLLGMVNINAQKIDEEVAETLGKATVNVKNIEKKNESATPPKVEVQPTLIDYEIIDIPASSDFKTSDLPPSTIKELPQEKLYENYIESAYGNLSHLWIDGYFQYPMNVEQKIGARINHNSSKGLKDFEPNVDTKYSESKGQLFFESALKGGQFHSDFNFHQNNYNLFGSSFPDLSFPANLAKRDVQQRLTHLGGKASYKTFENKFFNRASFQANYLSDVFDSRELDVALKAHLDKSGYIATLFNNDFDLGGEVPFFINFTNSSFSQGFEQEYSYFHTGIAPVAKLIGQQFDFKLGASVEFLSESKQGENKFLFFPEAKIEYKGLEAFKVFAGINGGLQMHSYENLLTDNPYLFPDQSLIPTRNTYLIFGGVKGDVGNNFSYWVQGSYTKAKNILFFTKRQDDLNQSERKAFQYFNTFDASYDNGNIFGVEGELKYLQIENLNIGLHLLYQGFDLDNYNKILNRPNFTGQINGSYQMLEDKLTLGTELYFVGNRTTNDFSYSSNVVTPFNRTLDSYFDANFSADYALKPYLNLFVKGINVFNAENEIYAYYPMQGIQFLGGALFKF